MEKQIEQLLQGKNLHKEFCIYKIYQSKIVDCIHKIQNVPLEKLTLQKIKKESILDIFDAFKNLNLKKLALYDCEIDSNVATRISHFIPNLIELALFDKKICSSEFITLIDAVKHSHFCSRLQLGNIIFDEIKTAALIDCIEKSRLVNLSLISCSESGSSFALSSSALSSILNAIPLSSLQILDLYDINFDNEITVATISCIKHSRLIKLTLRGCTFVNNKILAILQAVQQSSIQSLNVGYNFFDDNIEDVMKCVSKSNLTKFFFGEYKIRYEDQLLRYSNEEMTIIASAIKNCNLLTVGLNYMRINDELIDSIKRSSIISLDLYHNYFSDDKTIIEHEIAALCDLLEYGQLKKLKIALDEIDNAHIQIILSSVKKSELIKFYVYGAHNLNAHIKKEIIEIRRAQKLSATSFNKMKSARTIIALHNGLSVQ